MKLFYSMTYILVILTMFDTSYAQTTKQISNNANMQIVNNLGSLHDTTKSLSVQVLFKGIEGVTRSLQIIKDGLLPEHTTQTEALLICVSGEVEYEDEKNRKYILKPGDYYSIEPKIKHWVKGILNSQLLLLK